MDLLIAAVSKWIESHLSVLFMGTSGTFFALILSKEKWRDRIIGLLAGAILYICFSDILANWLSAGKNAGVFAFVLGAAGKDTAIAILAKMRRKTLELGDKSNGDVS